MLGRQLVWSTILDELLSGTPMRHMDGGLWVRIQLTRPTRDSTSSAWNTRRTCQKGHWKRIDRRSTVSDAALDGTPPPPFFSPTESNTYHVSFPKSDGFMVCPVEGCQGRAVVRTNLWVHFVHRHVKDAVVILEEVNLLHL